MSLYQLLSAFAPRSLVIISNSFRSSPDTLTETEYLYEVDCEAREDDECRHSDREIKLDVGKHSLVSSRPPDPSSRFQVRILLSGCLAVAMIHWSSFPDRLPIR
jgi:hypothetical protein